MYEIWADNQLIYSDVTPLETVKVVNPKLTLADSAAGQLDMSLPPINVGYESIKRMTTDITVKCDGEWLWSGRVLQDDYDFWNNRKMVCEGEIAFLNDSIQPPAKYNVTDDPETNTTIFKFFKALIDIHNSQVEPNRQFHVGMVTVSDGDQQDDDDSINRFTNYETTLECMNDKLLSRLGGHLRVRHVMENGAEVRYLDYISDDTLDTNSQIVRFGVNLLDFSKNIDMSQLSTVIVPRGARLEDESDVEIEGLEPYLTVKTLENNLDDEGNVTTDPSKTWHEGSTIFVKNPTAINNFGWICAVVDWDAVTDVNNLYKKAVKYLKDEQYEKMSLEIKAVDLKYMTYDAQSIKFLSKLRCISEPHGMDHTFIVSKVEIDLANPGNCYYTLGSDVQLSLTQAASRVNSQVQAQIDKIPSKSEILRAAELNAYQMITGSENSYVHFIPYKDENGKPNGIKRIEVTNGAIYDEAADLAGGDPFPNSTHRWIWTVGGLGHVARETYEDSWDGYDPETGEFDDINDFVAMTMDGQIVADRITTGYMHADRIQGGVLTLGGRDDGYGKIDVKDANDNLRIKVRHDRFEAEGGYIVTLGSGYVKHHERDQGEVSQWVFDLGCRFCNCEYYEDGSWHWVNGRAVEIYKYLQGAYNDSDQRAKTKIETLEPEFSKELILGSKPKMFEYIYNEGIKQFGMIAQEEEKLLNDIGFTEKNGLLSIPEDPNEWMSIEYKQFVPHLINCIQDLYSQIKELKANK